MMTKTCALVGVLAAAGTAHAADDEPPGWVTAESAPPMPARRIWLGLGLGSGAGYAHGNGLEAFHQYVSEYRPGFAPAAVAHAVPEIGWFLRPNVALSLQGRLQWRPHQDRYTADGAWAVLGRALVFTEGTGLRFYGGVALGGGDGFRLVVKARTTDDRIVQDTVRGGPLLTGGGGGFSYPLGERVTWIVESNLLIGMPIASAVLDVNTGLRAAF